MKTRFIIFLNKLITKVSKLLGKNATVFPASLVLPLDHDILNKITYPKYVIGITGSSGKGSTTSITAHILKENGFNVIWNDSGSNVLNGIATLVLNNTSLLTKKLKGDVLLLELDESYLKRIFKKGMLTHLVVTNITRDQPPRNRTPESVLNKIIDSVDDRTHIILNADDPLVNRFTLNKKGKITTYGLDKTKYSYDEYSQLSIDGAYCPVCSKKLNYDFYHYGHLGSYDCLNCDYTRKTDLLGSNLDLEKKIIEIENNKININNNGIFTAYNTLAAYALCKELGIDSLNIVKAFNNQIKSKRMQKLKLDDRDVIMIESKNENNISYLLSLYILNEFKEKKTIILGFDNVSRRYKHNDLSWLYDVDFNKLNTDNVDRIFCIGRFRFDVAARLINGGIDQDRLILVSDLSSIVSLIKENSSGTIFTMVCFDMTDNLRKLFKEAGEKDDN